MRITTEVKNLPNTYYVKQKFPDLKNYTFVFSQYFKEITKKIIGNDITPYFLTESDYDKLVAGTYYNVHPLAFLDYSEEAIFKRITELGWQPPKDTDSNSSNCLLNSFANQTHIDAYGFHPYAFEIAGLVRTGVMSREEGLEKIEAPQNQEIVRKVKEKLGL